MASRREALAAERGYTISYKQLGLAFLAEAFVIAASLYGAYLFAEQYAHNDIEFRMMMLAPVGYAIIELARVPLALAVRTQPSWLWKAVALIGVLCAAGVTVKSMSQLGEIMFRPRLITVMETERDLLAARDARDSTNTRIRSAQTVVDQRQGQLNDAEARVKTINEQIGQLGAPTCSPTVSFDRKGRQHRGQACSKDPRAPMLAASLEKAQADRDLAAKTLDEARATRGGLDPGATDTAVTTAEMAYRKAVMNSQLHSFTAMAFGIDPTEVTDGQIHTFLRLFVFLPAIFVSLAATMLAMTAVTRHRPRAATVNLPDDALESFIDPFAREVIARAAAASERRVIEILEAASRLPTPSRADPLPAGPAQAPPKVPEAADAAVGASTPDGAAAPAVEAAAPEGASGPAAVTDAEAAPPTQDRRAEPDAGDRGNAPAPADPAAGVVIPMARVHPTHGPDAEALAKARKVGGET